METILKIINKRFVLARNFYKPQNVVPHCRKDVVKTTTKNDR